MKVCPGCGNEIHGGASHRVWCETRCRRRDQRSTTVVELAPYHWHKAPSVRLYLGALANRTVGQLRRDRGAFLAADRAMGDALDLMRDDQGLQWEPRRLALVDQLLEAA